MRYIMIYKISNKRSIKILSEKFVDNNKNEGNIIYNNHKYHLTEEFPIQNKNRDKLKIVMELSMNINDLSCMFENCDSLLEFRDYYDIREINIEEENKYSELIEIEKNKYSKHLNGIYNKIYYHDNENYRKKHSNNSTIKCMISKLSINQNQFTNMSKLFYNCKLLMSLPDISR